MVTPATAPDAVIFHEISACRICRSAVLREIIDLGHQALTGCFPRADEPDPPRAPLVLVRCPSCGLVQMRHSVSAGAMFGESYGYRSGINATMTRHLGGITRAVAATAELAAGDAVLDIGCNDGTLLQSYAADGIERFGIDPSAGNFRDIYPPQLKVHTGFFSADAFRNSSGRTSAKVITSIAMFYDLEDPVAFSADIAAILDPEGIWVLEQSYLPSMLEANAFDTICHEHLEYYALAQIDRMARMHRLRVFDVSVNDINGGSFQVWICHDHARYAANRSGIDALVEREQRLGLLTDTPFAAFRERVSAIGARLGDAIRTEVGRGKKIYVYGASTKGNVLLQYFGIDRSLIQGCADRNPSKWGRRTPGTGIPIVSEEEARAAADYFLVLPWHFRNEFLAREAEFRARGGKLIFPLPEVEIV